MCSHVILLINVFPCHSLNKSSCRNLYLIRDSSTFLLLCLSVCVHRYTHTHVSMLFQQRMHTSYYKCKYCTELPLHNSHSYSYTKGLINWQNCSFNIHVCLCPVKHWTVSQGLGIAHQNKRWTTKTIYLSRCTSHRQSPTQGGAPRLEWSGNARRWGFSTWANSFSRKDWFLRQLVITLYPLNRKS